MATIILMLTWDMTSNAMCASDKSLGKNEHTYVKASQCKIIFSIDCFLPVFFYIGVLPPGASHTLKWENTTLPDTHCKTKETVLFSTVLVSYSQQSVLKICVKTHETPSEKI